MNTQQSLVTRKPYTLQFMHYGEITVPIGTPTTHETAAGKDEDYNFVNALGWIDTNYPDIANILKHDVRHHGIDIPKEYLIATYNEKTANQINLQLLHNKLEERGKTIAPLVGDYLLLPYGIYTRFTHIWEDRAQTGGGSNSFYLCSNGDCSYSGSLDSGVKLDEIELTQEVKEGEIWFFDKGISGADRGVHYAIPCRVFKPKEGADLNGCPQIKRHEENLIIAKSEQITLINGNNQPYTIHLPKLVIKQDELQPHAIENIFKKSGLLFVKCNWGYECQPMTCEQITKLFCSMNFKTTRYANGTWNNHIFLTFNN